MDWDKLRTFHAAAEAGSLTAAADTLGLSQSAVSRQIAALEQQLGASLFHRHPRGLQLTPTGRLLSETTSDVAARIARAEASLIDARDTPAGPLRVVAPTALGTVWLTPRLRPFLDTYPEIALDIVLEDFEVDLPPEDVTVAIRLWRPEAADLVARRFLTVRQGLYASPEYLARAGVPREIGDLDGHPLVCYGAHARSPMRDLDWVTTVGRPDGDPRPALLKVSSVLAVSRAIRSGIGIGSLPDYLANALGGLAPVLPEVRGPELDAVFVYREELKGSRRVSAFWDFLTREARTGAR